MRTMLLAVVLVASAGSLVVEAKKPIAPGRAAATCGLNPDDWCPSPPGDPCGKHKDVASCKADRRCKGMRYRGESAVACDDDGRGFSHNCPTVGCISE
jgi:hypothetical protein